MEPAPPAAEIHGLDDVDVLRLREQWGSNSVAQVTTSALKSALGKFWAPVPWLLEAAILIQLGTGDYTGAGIVGTLLMFNAALAYTQEASATKTLAVLMARLALQSHVERDEVWRILPGAELVPGDIIKISLGEVVPADVRIVRGSIQADQSMLTGESMPVNVETGATVYAGALVQRGEALATVVSTGRHTKFGTTAELVRAAHSVSSQQGAVMHVVRNLVLFNGAVILLMVPYATLIAHMSRIDSVHLVLTALLASIPVALPATFTLAAAIGARALAKLGVLATRLSAVDEAATMNILCVDKTGTLTCNALTVDSVYPVGALDAAHVLALAKLTSSDAGQDPVDRAIRQAAATKQIPDQYKLVKFVPFDPATKMAQATVVDEHNTNQTIVKGAFSTVAALIQPPPDHQQSTRLEQQGCRVLAVAIGQPGNYRLEGLIALTDPPRSDAATLIKDLQALGVRIVMLTGDATATAISVARLVGITGADCPGTAITDQTNPERFTIFSELLPKDKFRLVQLFQKQGHVIGMCGDGANDAPALRQAQIGIAVSSATDGAKSAAGMVLTEPGLVGIVAAVHAGRTAFQRILTYTLNSITKKIVQILLLVFGLVLTGHAVLTPVLMAIVMICGDFLGMSLTTDHVQPSTKPNAWQINRLTWAGVLMGVGELIYCAAALSYGWLVMHLPIVTLQTMAFVVIVFGNQATTYCNRVRGPLWSTKPGRWVVAASIIDIGLAAALAGSGTAMAVLPLKLIIVLLLIVVAFTILLDLVKVRAFALIRIT